jgi:hypothetical protein
MSDNICVYINFSKHLDCFYLDMYPHFPNFMYDVENRILQKSDQQIKALLRKVAKNVHVL